MRKNVGLLLLVSLAISSLTTSCDQAISLLTRNSGSALTESAPIWYIDPALSNIGIIVLDYRTLHINAVFIVKQDPCSASLPGASDDELRASASGIFNAVGRHWSRGTVTPENRGHPDLLGFETKLVRDLAILELPPENVGGVAVLHRCSGLVIFAGSIIRGGRGDLFYPSNPIISSAFVRNKSTINPPLNIDVVTDPAISFGAEEDGLKAWAAIQDLNIVQELAAAPYDVFIYLYPRSVGEFKPENALWVIFEHLYPVNQK